MVSVGSDFEDLLPYSNVPNTRKVIRRRPAPRLSGCVAARRRVFAPHPREMPLIPSGRPFSNDSNARMASCSRVPSPL